MCQNTLEVVKSFDLRPLPFRQHARTIDEHVACVPKGAAVFDVPELDVPKALNIIPLGTGDFGVEFDEFFELMLGVESHKVLLDLGGVSVVGAPVGIRVEWKCVCMCRAEDIKVSLAFVSLMLSSSRHLHVTGTSRISILIPGTARYRIFLVADELVISEHLPRFVGAEHSSRTHADMNDADPLGIALWVVRYGHWRFLRVRHGR